MIHQDTLAAGRPIRQRNGAFRWWRTSVEVDPIQTHAVAVHVGECEPLHVHHLEVDRRIDPLLVALLR